MMVRLYYFDPSPNCRKVHLALEEVGADYEIVHLDLTKGEQKGADYLELNPNGKVPTIVDGDFVLWESNAILAYLGEKYPATELVPQDRLLRARVNQLLFWQATLLGPAVGSLFFASRIDHPTDPARVDAARRDATRALAVLGALLGGRTTGVGQGLTIADLALGPFVELAMDLGLEAPSQCAPWLAALRGRKSWRKVYAGS
ncbi:MAG: glutathione S-transferase family protein [Deltaproteobacteria bacterium]|nr:glutathione S-transferase family protein [Deltaproteobacteria bacterium]